MISDIKRARTALIGRILEGEGHASATQRRAAEAPGLSEDQIFELVVCAAAGPAEQQSDIALTAFMAASEKE